MHATTHEVRRTESRTEIVRAAIEVLASRGCAGATVGRIAAAAGLSTAAVFWHFKDKSRLLQAVAQHIKEAWVARVKTEALAQDTGRVRLERIVEHHLAWIATDPAELRAFVLLGLESRGMKEARAAAYVAELGALFTGFLAAVVRDGQRDGSLGRAVDPDHAAAALTDLLFGASVRSAMLDVPPLTVETACAVVNGFLAPDQISHTRTLAQGSSACGGDIQETGDRA